MRRRVRLVPRDAVEVFEIRTALYFTRDGLARVRMIISDPDEAQVWPPLHEALGVLDMTKDILKEQYYDGDSTEP